MITNSDLTFDYLNDIVNEHVQEYDENNIDDYTSAYIKEMRRTEAAGEPTSMSCKHIRCLDFNLPIALALSLALVITITNNMSHNN